MIRNYLICETLTNYHILQYLTDCNNCFIIRLPTLFSYLNHPLTAQGGDLPFFTAESRTVDLITDEQSIICKQYFAGHAIASRLMESKKNFIE